MDAFSLGPPPFKSVSSQGESLNSWGSILNSLTSLEFHSEILVSVHRDISSMPSLFGPWPCTAHALFLPSFPSI